MQGSLHESYCLKRPPSSSQPPQSESSSPYLSQQPRLPLDIDTGRGLCSADVECVLGR